MLLILLLVLSCLQVSQAADDAWQHVPKRGRPTDHSTFFQGPFADGPAVTRACLQCHPKAASEVMQTAHWNWVGDEVKVPGHEQPTRIGKRNLINNFCIGIQSNWPGCTNCHIGFGWKDEKFDFSDASLVDCLVCHEQTGNYHKDPGEAGWPAEDVDLLASAKSVGLPSRSNCGACHFNSGGGNAVKHGDLDESLLFPNPEIDVHMGKLGFQCIDCHLGEDHLISGRLLTVSVDNENRLSCTRCHQGDGIHSDRRIDAHTRRVACQTCHIPLMAFKEGTKMAWDWSEAGKDLPITNTHLYLKIKGRFTWVRGAQPEYAWYNGTATHYLLGDKIDPQVATRIAAPLGDKDDENAKLYPFKIHRGKQAYDVLNRYFILPHTFGEKGFWTQFDWDQALTIGSKATGLAFSGVYDFAPTEMYIPQNHMVVPKERALQCPDCHGENGRMDWRLLGYENDPLGRSVHHHEPIPLLDADEEMVFESGNPVSTAATCSQCHEIDEEKFVSAHAYHLAVELDALPENRRQLMRHGPRFEADGEQQANCFLCHLDSPNLSEWQSALHEGNADWAVSATLVGSPLLKRTADGYEWDASVADEDEMVRIDMAKPRPRHCGACHGKVQTDQKALFLSMGDDRNWVTENTGQVFSSQPINLSALNLQGKDGMNRAWDIHAQRLVICADCHYAQNRPRHLMDASGKTDPHNAGDLRTCDSCHTEPVGHDWLPEKDTHFAALACEACHAPRLNLPARQQVDASVLTLQGEYPISYRGLQSGKPDDLGRAFITGYQPLLSPRDGDGKWAPVNLVSRWYWVDAANGEQVTREQLAHAWLAGDNYRREVLELFDDNANGTLEGKELRLDRADKIQGIASLLREQGLTDPQLRAELRAHHIHHNMALGEATRECARCHDEQSETFALADYLPGNVLPSEFHDVPASIAGQWKVTAEQSLLVPYAAPAQGISTGEQEER